jgi:hypothetical protein
VELASIDIENAFNSADRVSIAASIAMYAPTFYKAATWAYNSPSILATEEGPLFFSLAFCHSARPDLATVDLRVGWLVGCIPTRF